MCSLNVWMLMVDCSSGDYEPVCVLDLFEELFIQCLYGKFDKCSLVWS